MARTIRIIPLTIDRRTMSPIEYPRNRRVAAYDNGRLKAEKRDAKIVYTGATETLTVGAFTDEEKGDTVKAFLWGIDSMYPVAVKTITQ